MSQQTNSTPVVEEGVRKPKIIPTAPNTSIWFTIKPFLVGGLSGCVATSCTQPVDSIKVRIQCINEENMKLKAGEAKMSIKPFDVARLVIKESGVAGFYKGIDAALLRQILYCTIRLGLYRYCSDMHKNEYKRNLTMLEKSMLSMVTGWVGSVFGNPADVALIRFQSDTLLPKEQRRNYKHVGDALSRMIKEEGILSLWRGSMPSIVRAGLMNMGMIAPYEEIKERLNALRGTQDALSTRIIASIISGLVASTLSLPADNIKTKLQRMKPNAEGVLPYKGLVDCFIKSIQREGLTGLWVGLPTFMTRVSPHAVITLLFGDAVIILSKKYGF